MPIYTEIITSHQIEAILFDFVSDIEGLRTASHSTGRLMQTVAETIKQNYEKFIETDCRSREEVSTETGENRTLIEVPSDKLQEFRRLDAALRRANRSLNLVPRNFVVSIVSQYDVFLSRLVRAIFSIQPSLLNQSEKVFGVEELLDASSKQELVDSFIDDEIDTLLRKSHPDQFTWMENRFHIPLRKGLDIWPEFVEITQRRNLFVHADGKVSKQYRTICSKEGVLLKEDIVVGTQLFVNRSYVERTFATICEVGIKLAQVLWRKHDPANIKEADYCLNEIAVRFIDERKYDLAKNLLDFACEILPRAFSRETRQYFIINRALAWKLSGNEARCKDILQKEDWSADNIRFHLALAALEDDLAAVLKMMREIGNSGIVKPYSYREWPLFRKFRTEAEFGTVFEEIFGAPLLENKKIEAGRNEVLSPLDKVAEGPALDVTETI